MVRLYINTELYDNQLITLDNNQRHYLLNVLRLKKNDKLYVFNDNSGEWLASIENLNKNLTLRLHNQTKKPHINKLNIILAVPIIKIPRLKILIEKATELGATSIDLIITEYTQIHKVNIDSLIAIAIEAAEQSERINLPKISTPSPFAQYLHSATASNKLILIGDETGGGKNILELLRTENKHNILLIVGPEGGWSPSEMDILRNATNVNMVSLGKNILRSETAMLTMLAATILSLEKI